MVEYTNHNDERFEYERIYTSIMQADTLYFQNATGFACKTLVAIAVDLSSGQIHLRQQNKFAQDTNDRELFHKTVYLQSCTNYC